MGHTKGRDDRPKRPGDAEPAPEVVLEPAGEVVITPEETAARAPEGKRIHPRRPLPPVPDARPGPGPKRPGAPQGGPGEDDLGPS